ncbi:hypothetical protein KA025_03215 [Candidatus Saccharibacteria bacterium]|nr:hypothetical protein [Candidatus Saccharibacteria bacterium]MBP9115748.1 hypothetical protein [Acidimicrobiia bacterium]
MNRKEKKQNGFMAIEWVVGMALLVVPAFILVISMMQYPPRKALSQVAASEAATAYVQANNDIDGVIAAQDAAKSVIDSELGAGSYSGMTNVVEVDKHSFCPGGEVKVIVKIPVPLLINPFVDKNKSDSDRRITKITEVKSSATERIDDYREIVSDESC